MVNSKYFITFITFALITFVLISFSLISSHSNNMADNQILSEIIYNNISGNEAIKYCIKNYNNEHIVDSYIPKKCYDLVQTRNSLH